MVINWGIIIDMKFKLKKYLKSYLWILFSLVTPLVSLAQSGTGNAPTSAVGEGGTIQNPIPNINSIEGLIKTILEALIKIGIPLVALAIVYSGFLFVAARGKPDALKKAKDAFIYSLIGGVILLGAWAIATLLKDTVDAL